MRDGSRSIATNGYLVPGFKFQEDDDSDLVATALGGSPHGHCIRARINHYSGEIQGKLLRIAKKNNKQDYYYFFPTHQTHTRLSYSFRSLLELSLNKKLAFLLLVRACVSAPQIERAPVYVYYREKTIDIFLLPKL